MKPSDIKPDTIFQLQMNSINLNTTQSSINSDITDIRFTSLQIQDKFSSSAEAIQLQQQIIHQTNTITTYQ